MSGEDGKSVVQSGWDVFFRAPKVEGFELPECAKAGEVSWRATDIDLFGESLSPWVNE